MNSAGAKRSERICNNKFKEDDLVHCNVDMFVYLRYHYSQRLIDSGLQVR